ncbi:MAG: hypothetical protein ACWGMZ_00315 [Thermoguttaceae bacterium]
MVSSFLFGHPQKRIKTLLFWAQQTPRSGDICHKIAAIGQTTDMTRQVKMQGASVCIIDKKLDDGEMVFTSFPRRQMQVNNVPEEATGARL